MLGASNDGWSNEEFDSALASFFPEPHTVNSHYSEANAHSYDSDSEAEAQVVIEYPGHVNTDINVRDVTTDFVENILGPYQTKNQMMLIIIIIIKTLFQEGNTISTKLISLADLKY